MSDADQWITFDDGVQLVRARIDASIGRAEAAMKVASTSGEVRTKYDGVVLTNDDGLLGWGGKPHVITGSGKRLFSRDDLLDWLNRQAPEQKPAASCGAPTRRGGRPPAYDWQAIQKVTFELMDENGDFSVDDPDWNVQARLEETLTDRFGVGTSQLRAHLPKFLEVWRKAKAGN